MSYLCNRAQHYCLVMSLASWVFMNCYRKNRGLQQVWSVSRITYGLTAEGKIRDAHVLHGQGRGVPDRLRNLGVLDCDQNDQRRLARLKKSWGPKVWLIEILTLKKIPALLSLMMHHRKRRHAPSVGRQCSVGRRSRAPMPVRSFGGAAHFRSVVPS